MFDTYNYEKVRLLATLVFIIVSYFTLTEQLVLLLVVPKLILETDWFYVLPLYCCSVAMILDFDIIVFSASST